MAQHDYVIDNSTGANVRADINSVLQAIATNNSGSSAPSATFGAQFFADTSNSIMKLRNTSNDGFIELFKLDGTFLINDGSAGSPSIARKGDSDTGLFFSGDNVIDFTAGGTGRVSISTTQMIINNNGDDFDFRVEGDTQSSLLKIDGGTERIGICDSSPDAMLHVFDFNSASDRAAFKLEAFRPKIRLQDRTSSSSSAEILCDTNDFRINLSAPSDDTTNLTERFRIDSAGRIGVGTSSPSSYNSFGDNLVLRTSGNTGLTLSAGGTSDCTINFSNAEDTHVSAAIDYDNNTNLLRLRAGESDGVISFCTVSSTERARINSDGRLMVGETSNAAFTANLLVAVGGSSTAGITTNSGTTSNRHALACVNNNGHIGGITTSGSTTSFNTESDYRLKENAVAISDGITRLKTLKPYRFNFKADRTKTVDGFFAHEVTAVPEAISGTKDEVVTQTMIDAGDYEEGTLNNPIYQQIDQSKLVPLLVAAVQELIGKVEALEAA